MKFLFFDTETGGLDLNTSLLTAFFAVVDSDTMEVGNTLDLHLRPDDGIYNVTGQALAINKIDLVLHTTKSSTYKEAGTELYNWLAQNKPNDKGDMLMPVGHGISFDLRHIWDKLLRRNNWEKFVSYRLLDTGIIFRFLQTACQVPTNKGGSLGELYGWACEKLGEKHPLVDTVHTANADTYATIHIMKALKRIWVPHE